MRSTPTAIGIAALLVACARTHVTSMRDPAAPRRLYHRVLVALPINDLSERQLVENRFASERDNSFIPAYRVLFPGRTYSGDELTRSVLASGSDAVLVITLSGAGKNHSVSASSTTSSAASCTAGGCAAVSAATTDVYDISKPWATFTATLFDVQSGQAVWFATSQTKGNAYAKANTLLMSMAASTIDQLRRDGIVGSHPRPNEH